MINALIGRLLAIVHRLPNIMAGIESMLCDSYSRLLLPILPAHLLEVRTRLVCRCLSLISLVTVVNRVGLDGLLLLAKHVPNSVLPRPNRKFLRFV